MPTARAAAALALLLASACAEEEGRFGLPDPPKAGTGADGAADGTSDGAADGAPDGASDGASDGTSDDGASEGGGSDDGSGGDAAGDSGWPDSPAVARAPVSVVVDGELAADGAALTVGTAPAGIDEDTVLDVVLTNRSPEALALPTDAAAWLAGAGWALGGALPPLLAPEESLALQLRFNPAAEAAAARRGATFTVPVDGGPTLTLTADVPRPLRLVITGDNGWLAVSDDYGRSVRTLSPAGDLADGGPIAWGDGRFFRAVRSGAGWFTTGVYSYSEDGELWSPSTFADEFWVGDCAYGLGRFLCLRSDTVTWSVRGETVYHEATSWGPLRNGVAFADGRFIAVGRSGSRVWSEDGAAWGGGDAFAGGDEYRDIVAFPDATGSTVWVAVGGTDRMLISRSVDGGATWTDQTFCDARYAHLLTVAAAGGVVVATGGSNVCDDVWRSEDAGLSWSPVALGSGDFGLLGAFGGAFLGVRQPWGGAAVLLRSVDGLSWAEVATLPAGVRPRSAAIEGR